MFTCVKIDKWEEWGRSRPLLLYTDMFSLSRLTTQVMATFPEHTYQCGRTRPGPWGGFYSWHIGWRPYNLWTSAASRSLKRTGGGSWSREPAPGSTPPSSRRWKSSRSRSRSMFCRKNPSQNRQSSAAPWSWDEKNVRDGSMNLSSTMWRGRCLFMTRICLFSQEKLPN